MITPGTLYRFRRNDLLAALERVPQQVRPKGLYRLTKDEMKDRLLWTAERLPEVALMVQQMANKLENPQAAILARCAA